MRTHSSDQSWGEQMSDEQITHEVATDWNDILAWIMRPAIAQLLNNSPCLMRREEIGAGQKGKSNLWSIANDGSSQTFPTRVVFFFLVKLCKVNRFLLKTTEFCLRIHMTKLFLCHRPESAVFAENSFANSMEWFDNRFKFRWDFFYYGRHRPVQRLAVTIACDIISCWVHRAERLDSSRFVSLSRRKFL